MLQRRAGQDRPQGGHQHPVRCMHEPHGGLLQHHAAHAAPLRHLCRADAVYGHRQAGRPAARRMLFAEEQQVQWAPHFFTTRAPCRTIYSAIVEGHLALGGFDAGVAKLGPRLVEAMLELHRNVMNNFLPSAVKFHYQFNLRELSNITQARPPPLWPCWEPVPMSVSNKPPHSIDKQAVIDHRCAGAVPHDQGALPRAAGPGAAVDPRVRARAVGPPGQQHRPGPLQRVPRQRHQEALRRHQAGAALLRGQCMASSSHTVIWRAFLLERALHGRRSWRRSPCCMAASW